MPARLRRLHDNISRVVFGKPNAIRLSTAALLARGHVLIEDCPGLGKTMLARAIAQSIDTNFKRIQFTPDMLPTDVTGVSVFHPHRGTFEFVPGPVFTEVLLADEINRTSPRTQASLLEAMEERQVTVEGDTLSLPDLFFVIATQNPIDLEGTFPLPEAQLDRFLMRIEIGYPDAETERRILASQIQSHPVDGLSPVLRTEDILAMQQDVRNVHVSVPVQRYIVDIVHGTRGRSEVRHGASPRGALALMRSAQALSFIDGQDFVSPDGVQEVAVAVLSHRLILDRHRQTVGTTRREIIEQIVASVSVPADREVTRDGPAPAERS